MTRSRTSTRTVARSIFACLAVIYGAAAATAFLRYPPHASTPYDTLFSPQAATATQASTEAANPCRWRAQIEQALSQLHNEYAEAEKKPTIKELVVLDGKLRRFFANRPEFYPCGDEAEFWKDKYEKLGVSKDYWNLLTYSGKLLADAHRINPKSEYRKYTLFSTVKGIEPGHGLGVMPDIKAAHRYEREFPGGPFIEDTLSLIADFNKDLYMVLRDDLRDYKFDCFKPYIDKSPRARQLRRAQRRALGYYEKVLAISPKNARARESLAEVNNGTVKRWSFCAD